MDRSPQTTVTLRECPGKKGSRSRTLTVYGVDIDTLYEDIREHQNIEKRRTISVSQRVTPPPAIVDGQASAAHP